MTYDHWLDRWLPLLIERAAGGPILEIGCGAGDDTATLTASGLTVIAFDISPEAVAAATLCAPQARIERQDVRAPFPSGAKELGAVVAGLSLHYFPWSETLSLVERIRTALRPRGVLVSRLNSVEDHNYGASGYPAMERNYCLVDGKPKRFLDEASINELFSVGWRRLSLEHLTIHKYRMPKAVWELVVERDT